MTRIKFKRGTRAQLDAAAAASGLDAGEPYFITDEGRLAIGLSAGTYEVFAKVSEASGYPSIAYPKRSSAPKIVGDVVGATLTTSALAASRLYYFPLVVPRNVVLTGLRIFGSGGGGYVVSVGIYGNATVNGNDAPGTLLASVSNLSVSTAGNKDGALSYTLMAGELYWIGLISNAATSLLSLQAAGSQTSLGRLSGGTTSIGYLYAAGSGSTLPATAPTALTEAANVTIPCVYLLE
ncbi:MAG: hypothetical protein PHX38_09395 [Sulfuricella sp.]|nr:hypothetical protein [Sulfuricella sp.]